MKLAAGVQGFSAWYLTPSLRFGLHDSGGGFLGLTLLKFDVCVTWDGERRQPWTARKLAALVVLAFNLVVFALCVWLVIR
jgi:hypothetical protein